MRDYRKFYSVDKEGRKFVIAYGWKKAFPRLRFYVYHHATDPVYVDGVLLFHGRFDRGHIDDWVPYMLYFGRNLPRDIYLDLVSKIKKGTFKVPFDH